MRLDIGCGGNKKAGFLGGDIKPGPGVDYVVDLTAEPIPLADDSVDEIFSSHFLEHIKDPQPVLHEFIRVCKQGATIETWTPYLKHNWAYLLGHQTCYSETFWNFFCNLYPENHLTGAAGVIKLERIIYNLKPGILEELKNFNLPLSFAIKHLFGIVREMGVVLAVGKGEAYRDMDNYKKQVKPPQIFVTYSRDARYYHQLGNAQYLLAD